MLVNLLSFPRTGSCWLAYCIHWLTGLRSRTDLIHEGVSKEEAWNLDEFDPKYDLFKTHGHWGGLPSLIEQQKQRYGGLALVVILRDYKEAIPRELRQYGLEAIKSKLTGNWNNGTDYMAVLKTFHEQSLQVSNKTFLVYYEDLIQKPQEVLTQLSEYLIGLGFAVQPVADFMVDYAEHRNRSLALYEFGDPHLFTRIGEQQLQTTQVRPCITKGEALKFHALNIPEPGRIELDLYLQNNFAELYNLYLSRYSESANEVT